VRRALIAAAKATPVLVAIDTSGCATKESCVGQVACAAQVTGGGPNVGCAGQGTGGRSTMDCAAQVTGGRPMVGCIAQCPAVAGGPGTGGFVATGGFVGTGGCGSIDPRDARAEGSTDAGVDGNDRDK
jgi:hypothetical protein